MLTLAPETLQGALMSVTVDREPLPADRLGLKTVGQVLKHLRNRSRIVVQVLIDGKEPNIDRLGSIKKALVAQHTVFIKTADPRQLAKSVLAEIESQLDKLIVSRANPRPCCAGSNSP